MTRVKQQYILALDQGTTSSRAILFDRDSKIAGMAQVELTQIYPQPGWVEHDPMEIWRTQCDAIQAVLKQTGIAPGEIAAIGIANQRETAIVWDKTTGEPVCNAIVWQCRRTAALCDELKKNQWAPTIQTNTGLVVDAYFSGTKIKWILDHIEGARAKAENGQLLFGNVDTWLIWKLTRGKVHVTDYSNASRTMLYNIHQLEWDERILAELGIPVTMLPEVKPSSYRYGVVEGSMFDGAAIPICGAAGDQQAALFGQNCFEAGSAKNTYGTGCFILLNTGTAPVKSHNNLLTTIAWGIDGRVEYALEGSVFNAGSAVQWLRDEVGLIENAPQSELEAQKVPDTGGVYVVPAFTGLGAPYWDMYARGIIVGITRGTRKEHLIRATLEAIAYQSRDILTAMQADAGMTLKELKVDGGASVNDFLMQFQADLLGVRVNRPKVVETTALGAAYLAGLACGFWQSKAEIQKAWSSDQIYLPQMAETVREEKYARWQQAVERALDWER